MELFLPLDFKIFPQDGVQQRFLAQILLNASSWALQSFVTAVMGRGDHAEWGAGSPQEHWQGPLRDVPPRRSDRCLSVRRGGTRAQEAAKQGKKLALGGTGALLPVLQPSWTRLASSTRKFKRARVPCWCADTALWAGIAHAFKGFSVDVCWVTVLPVHTSVYGGLEYFTHFLHEGCLCSVCQRDAGLTVDSCSCATGVLSSAEEYK